MPFCTYASTVDPLTEETRDHMRHAELRLEFARREDKQGQEYLVCKPNLPLMVDLRDASFLFWPRDSENPTMVIAMRSDKGGERDE